MLSVCIPVYRYNVVPLARELRRQVDAEGWGSDELEILIFDDASPAHEDWGQQQLRHMRGVRYEELRANVGRAAIRNRMVRAAKGTYCLLLDADAELPAGYLARYRIYLGTRAGQAGWRYGDDVVVVGGRRYRTAPPADPGLHLHWWYGTRRESDAGNDHSQGWLGFHSNNFLASRTLLLAHPFPEQTTGYGHEDTLWGQQFVGTGVPLVRLRNSVVHLGLEPREVFLGKQREAVRNLLCLKSSSPHLRTRLTDFVEKAPRLTALARLVPERLLTGYLSREKPDLRALDVLKLKWWHRFAKHPKGKI